MRRLISVLWLAPLAVHVGYIFATYGDLPSRIGADQSGPGTSLFYFSIEWGGIICLANLVFLFVYWRLPQFSDPMLSVPGKAYWFSRPERRADLIARLRGILDAVLLGLNLFFLAVYQSIYQSNAPDPIVFVNTSALVFFFMVLPMVAMTVVILISVHSMAKTASRENDS